MGAYSMVDNYLQIIAGDQPILHNESKLAE